MNRLLIQAAVIFLCLSVGTVSALSFTPSRAEFTSAPGETLEKSITITSTSDKDETFSVTVESYDVNATNHIPVSKDDLASWIKVVSTVTVKKGEVVTLPYTITIPTSATTYKNNAIIFLTGESRAKTGVPISVTLSGVIPRVCTLLTKSLTRGGENNEVLALQKFLKTEGYLSAEPNGYFGQGTITAVKKFQIANGMSPVGSVGPVTRMKVKEVSCIGARNQNSGSDRSTEVLSTSSSTFTINDIKTDYEKNVLSQNGSIVPVIVSEATFSKNNSSLTNIDFSQVDTNNYFIKVYSFEKSAIRGYKVYSIGVGLGDRSEVGFASVVLMNVECGAGVEAKIDYPDYKDLCKKVGTSKVDTALNKKKKSLTTRISLNVHGEGEISGDILVSFAGDASQNKKPYAVLFKRVSFKVKASDAEFAASFNDQKLKDTQSILQSLQKYISSGGKIPASINGVSKEMCISNFCDSGLVDFSTFPESVRYSMPFEYKKYNEPVPSSGIGYMIRRTGDIFTVSAQYPEGGKVIESSGTITGVTGNNKPEVELSVTPSVIKKGEWMNVSRTSRNATSCSLTPPSKFWVSGDLYGSFRDRNNTSGEYVFTCTGPGGTATKSVKVTVTE